MEFEPVDVFVLANLSTRTPVEGVVVRVYSTDGTRRIGEARTDSTGRAAFLLPAPAEYDLRFYKFATGFTQPQRIVVRSETATPGRTPNQFEVLADRLERPRALDSRLCRASGFFRDVTGAPRAQLDMHFILIQPFLLEEALVVGERRRVKTDNSGYACVDLVRCAEYKVTMEAWEDQLRSIRVPDAPGVNLPYLLFPVVEQITLPASELRVGAEVTLTPLVFDSVGVPLPGTARQDVVWSIADPTVAILVVDENTITVRGVSRGSTAILAERKDRTIVRIPATPIRGVPASVVVT